jgi:Transglutaminase-like superfamily
MLHKFKRNFRSSGDIWLFIRIFGLITLLPIMVKSLSIPTLLKKLTPMGKHSVERFDVDLLCEKIGKYTDYILGHHLLVNKKPCLKRSLVLYHFFRKYGVNVQFCMGVRINKTLAENQGGRKLIGHAWIRYDGKIFMEKAPIEDKTYTETFCFPNIVFGS